jgi:hypothetical protein
MNFSEGRKGNVNGSHRLNERGKRNANGSLSPMLMHIVIKAIGNNE